MAKNRQIELPPIDFEAAGSTAEEQKALLETVEPTEGFAMMTLMCVDVIMRRTDVALFDFNAQAVPFRYQIDGIWTAMPGMDRATGDPMLASLKQLAGMNWQDRRNRQEGKFRALFRKNRYEFRVVSQGTKTGERVAIYIGRKRDSLDRLSDLGMRDGMKTQIAAILNEKQGLSICSAIPGEGMTACWRGFLAGGDRFMRDYYVIECEGKQEPEVINVNPVVYPAANNHFTPIPQLLLKEPQVLAFPDLVDGNDLNEMCDLASQKGLMILTRLAARNCAETITRALEMKSDVKKFATNLRVVLNMRLVRKLCETCRQPFPPTPQLLGKLGFPAGRIRQLYRPTVMRGDETDERGNPVPPCETCFGTGYVGRTGVFELFEIGDPMRKVIMGGETRPDALQDAAVNNGQVRMQDELALLVARGVTSLEEMQRVLASPKTK